MEEGLSPKRCRELGAHGMGEYIQGGRVDRGGESVSKGGASSVAGVQRSLWWSRRVIKREKGWFKRIKLNGGLKKMVGNSI